MIHEEILAAAGNDLHLLVADKVVHLVSVNAGSVDNNFCLKSALVCLNDIMVIFFHNVGYFCLKLELASIDSCILCECHAHVERIHQSASGNIECSHCIRCQVLFHGKEFFLLHDADTGNAVVNTLLKENIQFASLLRNCADDQRSVLLYREIQLLCQLIHKLITADIHLSHHGSGLTIITAVNDRTVGF